MIKLVVFDLDGTLVTAEINFLAMRHAIRDLFLNQGFPVEVLPMNSTQDLLRSAFVYAQDQGMPIIELSRLRDKAYEVAMREEWKGARKAQLVPGTIETLSELERRHVDVAVLTNDNFRCTEFLISKFGLQRYIGLVISRDQTPHMKPATDGLEIILQHFRVTPAEAIFVGDSTIDVLTAIKLGMKCIGRISKVRTAEELLAEGAIAVIPSLTELIPYLDAKHLLPPPL
ncbi:MAG: HAD family hydrolase [Promethearchaeota archaeon]